MMIIGIELDLYRTIPLNNPRDEGFRKHCENKSGNLSQDTPVLPQVVKLGHAPNKIQV